MANGTVTGGGRTKARTLFLSDIHLGFRHARVRELNEFLHSIEAECIVLVGDIVDALSLARRAFWSADHTQVARALLARQRAGVRLIYIPGNHDASLAMLAQMLSGVFEVHREWVHRTAQGERLLVLHGDQFDTVMHCPPWLNRLGDTLHGAMVSVSHTVNNLRRAFGRPYWPLTEGLKLGIGTSARYIEQFEQQAVRYAQHLGYDGVVCGHIHRANLRRIDATLYANSGDWVESCSALIENERGALELLRWPRIRRAARPAPTALAADTA
jgi:UDP-2,3-diacylglucosamine pyrophosphatase LpxH